VYYCSPLWRKTSPLLKPHELRYGVAMEVYEQHHDLEEVRALLGHTRIETTHIYVGTNSATPSEIRGGILRRPRNPIAEHNTHGEESGLRNMRMFLKPGGEFLNNINVVVPTGFEPVFKP